MRPAATRKYKRLRPLQREQWHRIGFVMAASRGWLAEVSFEMHKFINNMIYWLEGDPFALFKSNTNRLLMNK